MRVKKRLKKFKRAASIALALLSSCTLRLEGIPLSLPDGGLKDRQVLLDAPLEDGGRDAKSDAARDSSLDGRRQDAAVDRALDVMDASVDSGMEGGEDGRMEGGRDVSSDAVADTLMDSSDAEMEADAPSDASSEESGTLLEDRGTTVGWCNADYPDRVLYRRLYNHMPYEDEGVLSCDSEYATGDGFMYIADSYGVCLPLTGNFILSQHAITLKVTSVEELPSGGYAIHFRAYCYDEVYISTPDYRRLMVDDGVCIWKGTSSPSDCFFADGFPDLSKFCRIEAGEHSRSRAGRSIDGRYVFYLCPSNIWISPMDSSIFDIVLFAFHEVRPY